MSKYIKLEDAIHNINLEVVGRKEYTGDMKANLFFALDDLPTIEVSEDCENCKHENEPRFGTICGSCTKANSENFEPIVSEERQERQDAIDVLNAFTKAVEGTYADCISREDAIKAYNEAVDELVKAEMEEFNLGDFTECSFNTTQLKLIARKIADAPSVIPKPKEGEWLACTKEGLILNELARSLAEKWYGYKCSECGYIHKGNALRDFKFCPNCGAKMKG